MTKIFSSLPNVPHTRQLINAPHFGNLSSHLLLHTSPTASFSVLVNQNIK